jgi:hypothetical protein
VDALTETELRACFVNTTQGEAKRMNLPPLAEVAWEHLDFLGWVDPKAPQQAYLVAPSSDGPVGIALRRNRAEGRRRAKMCSLCNTVHPGTGVALMVAPRAGRSGRDGNTTGLDICADLACSAYVRGRKALPTMSRTNETLSVEDKVARIETNLEAFVARVLR